MTVHVFGVRHHGPGSARSLKAALTELAPDCILVEGPPDADGLIPMCVHPDLQPPAAILVYNEQHLRASGYFPFTVFSPEWNAMRYGVLHGVPVRFMDLPFRYRMASILAAGEAKPAPAPQPPDPTSPPPEPDIQQDPLYWLAKAAGYTDSERWWDQLIEHRRGDSGVFEAILQAMCALRESVDGPLDPLTMLREAYMRKVIRAAMRDGFKRIAVVCGAWHAPALTMGKGQPTAKHDQATLQVLKQLPNLPVRAAWIPWTHGRLLRATGYGAGIHAPGWYHYLWTAGEDISAGWVTRVAKLLRKYDLDASPAQIIDAVRLADTLAALRDRPIPGLQELNEAVLAALCLGQEAPLRLIYKELIVGETMGKVPAETGFIPLQHDLHHQAAALDLKIDVDAAELTLDLREERDLARSRLLHRLTILNLNWGIRQGDMTLLNQTVNESGSLLRRIQGHTAMPSGTFTERWKLQWQPEFAVILIDAGSWGATVEEAALAYAQHVISETNDLAVLVNLLDQALMADLPSVVNMALDQLQTRVSTTRNIEQIANSIPVLARISRYGSVRAVNQESVDHLIRQMLTHMCLLYPRLVLNLAHDAAQHMFGFLLQVDSAVSSLRDPEYNAAWAIMLRELLETPNTHPLIAGRAARLCMDSSIISRETAMQYLSQALSAANDPLAAALWLDGFLRGSGTALLYDSGLWALVNDWLRTPSEAMFIEALPALRRAFSGFSGAERRQIGERVRCGMHEPASARVPPINPARAARPLPIVAALLGLASQNPEKKRLANDKRSVAHAPLPA